MNKTALSTLVNEVNVPVTEHDTLLGKYCSYKAFYGAVINALENEDISTEYINERHYFRGLEKLNIVTRGNLSIKDDTCVLTINRMGSLYPNKDAIQRVYSDGSSGIYRMKRDTFGFNCENAKLMVSGVLNPIVDLLSKVATEMEVAIEKINDNKENVKALGMTVSDAKKVTCDRIINKYL